MQLVVEEGSAGRVIGSDRFRRDGTKGRRPWFYLSDLTLGRSRSFALWGRSRCVGHGEVFCLPTVEFMISGGCRWGELAHGAGW